MSEEMFDEETYHKAVFLERTACVPESVIVFHICATRRCYPDDCPSYDEEYCFLNYSEPKWLERLAIR